MLEVKQGDSYAFEAEKGFQKERFFLHSRLRDVTGVEEVLAEAGLQLYSHGKTIEFKTLKAGQQADITVFDLSGRQMLTAEASGNTSLATELGNGIYIVQLRTDAGVFAKRLLLK
jgi:hypothetical protein